MALNANKIVGGGKKVAALPPENYMARVVQVLDLGVQNQRAYEGKEKPPANEINVTYELVTEFMEGDDGQPDPTRPRWVSERFPLFNLRSERARSTQRYMALDPSLEHGGDWSQLVGKACLVAVVNNEKGGRVYNNVGSLAPPIKGIPVPALVNDTKVFDMEAPDMEVFTSLPDFLKEIMQNNINYEGSALQAAINGEAAPVPEPAVEDPVDEDIPL